MDTPHTDTATAGALDQLAQESALAMPPGLGDAPAAPAGPSDAESASLWAMLPKTLGSVLALAMPELQRVYTDDACEAWGRAMAPVARKYGWNLSVDSPELALLAASVPLGLGTVAAVMQRRRGAAPPGQGAAPGRPAGQGAAPAIPDPNEGIGGARP